jgi:hypothetical protein
MSLTICMVVVTRDRQEEVRRLLQSVKEQVRIPDKIVFIDSSESSPLDKLAADVLGDVGPKTEVIREKCTLPVGRNIGARASGCDIVSYIDDDTILEPQYFAAVEDFFCRDMGRAVAGVEGEITNPPGGSSLRQLIRTSINLLLFLNCPGKGYFRHSGWPRPLLSSSVPQRVAFISGSNMSFRYEILKRFMFDEDLLPGRSHEDVEICQRISKHHPMYHLPAARLQHLEAVKARTPSAASAASTVFNSRKAHRKNMPQTAKTRWALRLSFIGLFIHLVMARRVNDLGPFLLAVLSS